jgi:acyl-coenzyme A synthetase/AMP-(fatty) acid ligase
MTSIRDTLGKAPGTANRFLRGAAAAISIGDLIHGTSLGGRLPEFSGRSVLVAPREQLAAALALIELDGVARRVIICPPDLSPEYLPLVIAGAGVDAIVADSDLHDRVGQGIPLRATCGSVLTPANDAQAERHSTEWVLLTSGTTGAPKMLAHSLAGLTAAINTSQHAEPDVVWGTFYDIRRYGGLQIFLRAVLGRGSFVVSGATESPADYLSRLGANAATHVSGTPSHWRRALMSPQARAMAPRYVRLSGEIADQAILNALRAFYPHASVGHAFASTEAGVGFEVNDGLEGFPASTVSACNDVQVKNDVQMKIVDGSLRIRSARTAVRYVGEDSPVLTDAEGFVDTGDMVELRGDRYYFLGRRSGVINIGGHKVYPEEVEAVINRHPAVRMSLARSRKSPITGSLVVADVVLKGESDEGWSNSQIPDVKREILRICLDNLAAHKVPATIRVVPALEVAAAGKLSRHHA